MPNKNINKCVSKEEIGESLYYIDGSEGFYITKNIKIYKHYEGYGYYKMKQCKNNHNGYIYCVVTYKDNIKCGTKRVHRLVAKTFIENPNNYRFVGHKNNIKHDNSINNLYWTTNKENTQKAFDDGLNIQRKGIDNDASICIGVLENDVLIAVYGSMGEADRFIKNINRGFLSKAIKCYISNNNYKPRGKKFKYIAISKEEFIQYDDSFKNVSLEDNIVVKKPQVFKATNISTGEEIVSDNQKSFAREYNLTQAMISHAIKGNSSYGGWIFSKLGEIDYTQSSAYDTYINVIDSVKVVNIFDESEEMEFKTQKELKDYFGLTGHDIKQYVSRNNVLLDKWRVVI